MGVRCGFYRIIDVYETREQALRAVVTGSQ